MISPITCGLLQQKHQNSLNQEDFLLQSIYLPIFSLKKSCTSSFEIANCKPLSRYAFQQIDQYAELKFSNISKQEVLIVGPDFIKIESYKKSWNLCIRIHSHFSGNLDYF